MYRLKIQDLADILNYCPFCFNFVNSIMFGVSENVNDISSTVNEMHYFILEVCYK